MAEIKREPIIRYDSNGNPSYTFNHKHSWSDVVRWICTNEEDGREVLFLLEEHLGVLKNDNTCRPA